MARAPSVMTEDDDGDDQGIGAQVDVPTGLTGGGDTPRARESDGQGASEFTIVETDDDYKPLSGPGSAPREEIRAEDSGEETRQPREKLSGAERRRAQRAAAHRSEAELRTVRDENARLRAEFDAIKNTVTPRLDRIDESRYAEQLSGLTREIDSAARTVDDAITRMSDAVAAGDAAAHAAALREHTKATQRGYELAQQRTQLEASRTQPGERDAPRERQTEQRQTTRQPPPPMDPVVQTKTQDFAKQFGWLNLQKPDRDSRIALLIDSEVAEDGFDPRDDDYWEELESRMREAPQLAHKFARQQSEPRRPTPPAQRQPPTPERRGPMVGGAGGGSPASGARTVLMSPERKNGLIQAGILDTDGRTILDRTRFDRVAKGYMERDRANGAARQ